ncbi:transposase [Streptomyces coeruleoprunus]|uniref:Transposase n=1 Tax=Streptomyces coeruleoprunus TaxID=285563 RepID=A0ABV9XFN6_9ACTN
MIEAIAHKFQTGTQWVHLPQTYGNWRGVYNRLRMWALDGTWERNRLRLHPDNHGPRWGRLHCLYFDQHPAIILD